MLSEQAKNKKIHNIIKNILYWERIYPKNIKKIEELKKKLNDLV